MKKEGLIHSKFTLALVALILSLVFSQASCQTALKTPLHDQAPFLSPKETPLVLDLNEWDHLPKRILPVRFAYPTEDLWWISHLSISKDKLIAHFDRNELIAFHRPGGEQLAKVIIPKDIACLSSINNEEIVVYSLDSQERFIGISLATGKKLWSYEFLPQDPQASRQWKTQSMNKEVVLLESQASSYAYIALDVLNGKELWRSTEPCNFLGAQGGRFLFYEADHVVCYLISPGSKVKQLWKSRKLPHPMRIDGINEEYFFYPTNLKLEEYGFLIRWEDGKIIQDRLKTSYAQDIQFDRTILAPGLVFHTTKDYLVSCVDLATMSELWRIQFQPQQYLLPEAPKIHDFESLDLLVQDETIWITIQTFYGTLSYKVDKGSGRIHFALPYRIHEASENTLLHWSYEEDSAFYLNQVLCFASDSGKLLWKIEPKYRFYRADVLLLENLTVVALRDQKEKIFGLLGITDEDKQVVFCPVPAAISLHELTGKDDTSLFFWDEIQHAVIEICFE